MSASELPRDRAASAKACFYAGSQPSILRSALATLPALDSFTFLDLGCGKGRALLVATELPFQSIVGVELSTHARKHRCRESRLGPQTLSEAHRGAGLRGGRGQLRVPAGNVVLYLYHPFNVEMIDTVAKNVEAALAAEERSVYVVYYNPVGAHCFDAIPSLTRRYGQLCPTPVKSSATARTTATPSPFGKAAARRR